MNRPFLQEFPPWRVGEREMKARRICLKKKKKKSRAAASEDKVLELSMMILQSLCRVTSKTQVDGTCMANPPPHKNHLNSMVETPGQPE